MDDWQPDATRIESRRRMGEAYERRIAEANADFEKLKSDFRRELTVRRRLSRLYYWLRLSYVPFLIAGGILSVWARHKGHPIPPPWATILSFYVVSYSILAIIKLQRNRAQLVLQGPVDKHSIALVFDTLRSGKSGVAYDERTLQLAKRTLVHLLAQIQPDDAPLFTSKYMAMLSKMAVRESNLSLVQAIVSCFGTVGGVSELRALELLQSGRARCREARMRQCAAIALGSVRERVAHEAEQATLLRPADGSDSESRLLRLVAPADSGVSENLLKPIE